MSNDAPAPSERNRTKHSVEPFVKSTAPRCAKCGHTGFYAQSDGTCGYVDSEGGCECGRSHNAPAPAPAPAPKCHDWRSFDRLGGHTSPSGCGADCHECDEVPALRAEVERLDRRVREYDADRCENGHHRHEDCTNACACVGQGKSRIEQAEAQRDALFKALREIEGDCSDQWAVEVAAAAIKEAGK